MRKFVLSAVLFFVFGVDLFAASPVINSVTGDFSNGVFITIAGNGFGVNSLNIEWLGGLNGNIEQGIDGEVFKKNNWSVDADNDAAFPPRYSVLRSYTGTKSIMSTYDDADGTHYKSGFKFKNVAEIKEIYATWRVYYDSDNFDGQWKIWRLMPTADVRDRSSPQFHSRATGDGVSGSVTLHCRPNVASSGDLWRVTGLDDENSVHWLSYNTDWPGVDQWSRIELYMKGSDPGVSNGSFIMTNHRADNGINTSSFANNDGNLMTYSADQTSRITYLNFQNYLANGTKIGNKRIFVDDIFIQLDSRARVEIGDQSTWDTCTQREIQIPTAWTDTSITLTVNQGSFKVGDTAYAFVVDSAGNTSVGYPIVFGSGDTTAPGMPTGLTIQ